jgi:predicted transposase/invertase (TIGR01784 family)
MMSDLLEPTVDFVFKQIFGSEENKDEVLLNFLNEALRETEPKPFVSLTLLNPQMDKNALTDKQAILDVRAQNEDGKQVNLEIQVTNKYDMPKRSLYYSAKMYEEQLEEGHFYKNLKKVISINILTFNQIPNDRFHNTYHLREDHTGELLIDDIEIHFMELP